MSYRSSNPVVLPLEDPTATLEQVGGKGASLAHLAAARLPVPAGFHITTEAYRRFVEVNGLQEGILTAASAVDADQPSTLDDASARIGSLFAAGQIPQEIAEAIRRAYARLGNGELPVAVRSSATAEDLPEMSFAGQQETYLNIRGEAPLLDAVKRCWASLWTARAIGYRQRRGIAPGDVSLAVVVQELVPAEAAGVLFTANPLTGARDQVMINAAWGLGEAIVGGQVTPDMVVVDRASGAITELTVADKDVMTVRTAGGTREEPVPAERRCEAVLSPSQATELAQIGVQIEEIYGQPMDVEWAIQEGRVFVLQARPITALPEVATETGRNRADEWQLPDPRGRYMRTSVMELLPDPLSPLFATLGLPAWSRATDEVIRSVGITGVFSPDVLKTINGYGYYDLTFSPVQTVKMAIAMPGVLAQLPGLLASSHRRWLQSRSRYATIVDRWQSRDLATTSAGQLLSGMHEITGLASKYYLTVQSGILPAAYMSELLFTLVYNKLIKGRNDPPALTFVLGFDSAPIRAEKSLYDLAQWVREQPALIDGLSKMTMEQFATAYCERAQAKAGVWQEFWKRLDEHLASFGHTIYDLDFAKPVLADDPVPVLEALKYFVSGHARNPHDRQAATIAAREQAAQVILTRSRGLRSKLFRRVVGPAQRFAPLREDALADVGLGWPVLRRMVRELGRRLVAANGIDNQDDPFWLTLDELTEAATALDAGQQPADYRQVISERRATWERERRLTPPVALPLKGGTRFLGIDFTSMMPARVEQAEGNELKGIGASPGSVTGTARVIHGPEEFGEMRQGDILVARITTPAWTPLFALAAAVVTDVGGPLSHGSIVAREYHIPAVLGTGAATERLKSGQRITVDGDSGTVKAA